MTSGVQGVAAAIEQLQKRWGLTHHTAVHLLRLIGAVGGRTTSGRRSVLKNRLVGGVRGSRHLVGRAFDHIPPRGRWAEAVAFLQADRCGPSCRGPDDVLDERTHLHWEDFA